MASGVPISRWPSRRRKGGELLEATGKEVITVPFYDAALEKDAPSVRRRDYISPDVVRFGFLASPNAFNIAGLSAIADALSARIGQTFAPVELVIGGRVGEHVTSTRHTPTRGFVPTEAEFYQRVDYGVAPVFDGTGFKVKTADALALDMPSLFSSHSAEGTRLDASITFETPAEMADRMVEIAFTRPPIGETRSHVTRARLALKASAEAAAQLFVKRIDRRIRPIVFDLSSASPVSDLLVLQGFLSQVRVMSEQHAIMLLLSPQALKVVARFLPAGIEADTFEAFRPILQSRSRPRLMLVDVFGTGRLGEVEGIAHDVLLWDQRWGRDPGKDAKGALGELPIFHSYVRWEPAPMALVKALPKTVFDPWTTLSGVTRMVFSPIDCGAEDLGKHAGQRFGRTHHVRTTSWQDLQTACLAIPMIKPSEVAWAAPTSGVDFRAVLQACAIAGVPISGLRDSAFLAERSLPPNLEKELDGQVRRVLEKTVEWHFG
ncbi:MAG: glycosyltransferase [Rhodospirillales bacterium]|nr:glycosyltransferase [Rhodospirillales bacterium]